MAGRKKIKPEFAWDQLETETTHAFNIFLIYRNQGTKRSITKTAKALGKTYVTISKFFHKHKWKKRVEEYDRHRDRLIEKKKIDIEVNQIKSMNNKHRDLANVFLDVVRLELKKLLKSVRKDGDRMVISPDQLHRLAEFAAKLERLSLDEPSEITGTKNKDRKELQKLFEQKDAQGLIDTLNEKIME